MSRIFKFVKNNKALIVLAIIFLIIGKSIFTSHNNKIKEELQKQYTDKQTILQEKEEEIKSIDNDINDEKSKIEDIKEYIDKNSKYID